MMIITAKHKDTGAEIVVETLRINTPLGKRAVIITPNGPKLVPTAQLFDKCVLHCDGVEAHEVLSRLAGVN